MLSGGPGSGKTSLIESLRRRGFLCSAEAARKILQRYPPHAGLPLPSSDPLTFAEAMLREEVLFYRRALQSPAPVFFDRGIPDIIGYLTYSGISVPSHIRKAAAALRYNKTVLIAPPWEEIYTQDAERHQSYEQAKQTCQHISEAYAELGYDLSRLPLTSVTDRTDFILNLISA